MMMSDKNDAAPMEATIGTPTSRNTIKKTNHIRLRLMMCGYPVCGNLFWVRWRGVSGR